MPLASALIDIEAQIANLCKAILAARRSSDVSVRLATIPGICNAGKEFTAYLSLVPKQHSTDGKSRLGRITKMGNAIAKAACCRSACSALQHQIRQN